MQTMIVVGLQWGDEGKGKLVDLLSSKAQHVVRGQGGNNAGHTVVANDVEYRFHLIPSGLLYPHVRGYIGGGTVIDLEVLVAEVQRLEGQGVNFSGRLFLSPHAHLIFPYHRELDRLAEGKKGKNAIGTTGRGIGPCYADKVSRIGIQLGEIKDTKRFAQKLKEVLAWKNQEITALYGGKPLEYEPLLAETLKYREPLLAYIGDVEGMLAKSMHRGDRILFEGAHGTFLDTTFGTYPYVTSSSCLATGVCGGAGVGPSKIDHVLGVVKAYTTRVGSGPLPTELKQEQLATFFDHKTAREIGTTTGRLRRMGWFDAPLVQRAVELSGVDSLAITKLDVLDPLKEIPICTGYRLHGKLLHEFPSQIEDLFQVEPVLEALPGWGVSTTGIQHVQDMPKELLSYLQWIEKRMHVPISYISVGPEREKTLVMAQELWG